MKAVYILNGFFVVLLCGICAPGAFSQVRVLVDQVGYESSEAKQAILAGTEQDEPKKFELVDAGTAKTVYVGDLKPAGKVYRRLGRLHVLDCGPLQLAALGTVCRPRAHGKG